MRDSSCAFPLLSVEQDLNSHRFSAMVARESSEQQTVDMRRHFARREPLRLFNVSSRAPSFAF
jgi:hypothetical protein